MPHEEELPVEHRRRRVLGLERVRGIDERLSAQVDRLLGNVVENRGLPSDVSGDIIRNEGDRTLTKSCSWDNTHTVRLSVGYHVSCLSRDLSWNSWLKLSFSLISVPDTGFRAAARPTHASGSFTLRRIEELNGGRELTDQFLRIGQVLWLGHVISDFRLDDGLRLEEEARLGILQDHLQQMANVQGPQSPMPAGGCAHGESFIVLFFILIQMGDV